MMDYSKYTRKELEEIKAKVELYLSLKKSSSQMDPVFLAEYDVIRGFFDKQRGINYPDYYILQHNSPKLAKSISNSVQIYKKWLDVLLRRSDRVVNSDRGVISAGRNYYKVGILFILACLVAYLKKFGIAPSLSVVAKLKAETVQKIISQEFPGYTPGILLHIIIEGTQIELLTRR